jgi:antitoxin component of MazEF toxin-antitoxin module
MSTAVKVKKWGSSMAILIPSQFAKMRKISIGSTLDLENIQVVKRKRRRVKMSELMAKFKPEHRHEAWDVGDPVGKEIW